MYQDLIKKKKYKLTIQYTHTDEFQTIKNSLPDGEEL